MKYVWVLVAVLLPALSSAREDTRKIVCAAQEKQLLSGILYYAQENGGRIAHYALPVREDGTGGWYHWNFYILPFIDETNSQYASQGKGGLLNSCPSDNKYGWNNWIQHFDVSYGYTNAFYRHDNLTIPWYQRLFVPIVRVANPSKTPVFCDGKFSPLYPNAITRFDFRHKDGVNVSFLDGHVGYLDAYDVLDLPWNWVDIRE